MRKEFVLLNKLFPQPSTVKVDEIPSVSQVLSVKDKELLRRVGTTSLQLENQLREQLSVNYERSSLYREIDKAQTHWMCSSALSMFADVSTTLSSLQNSTVWVTSDSSKYRNELTSLFDRIGIEEKIYDWTWTTGSYGDFIPKVNAQPGLGVLSLEDDEHPINISRVDYKGVLVGFYETPLGLAGGEAQRALFPPWDYIHFRLLGVKKKRAVYCLRGDTKVSLLDGTSPTIREMAEDSEKYIGKSILSVNPVDGKLEYDEIGEVQKTRRNAQLVRVHLDNDKKYVDCTPDHKFMLRNGLYKEAQYLQPNESLMPYYKKISKEGLKGYSMVYNPIKKSRRGKGSYVYVHRISFDPKQKKGYVIHHKDFNSLNNDISNLVRMSRGDHVKLHSNSSNFYSENAKKLWRNPECRSMMLGMLEKARRKGKGVKRKHPEGCRCAFCLAKRGELNYDYLRVVKAFRTKFCACGCGGQFKQDSRYPQYYIYTYHPSWNKGLTKETDKRIMRYAKSVSNTLTGKVQPEEQIQRRAASLKGHPNFRDSRYVKGTWKQEQGEKAELVEGLLNHKVDRVEWLEEKEDTYDLTTRKNHNFPLDAGIFIHNSDPNYQEFRTTQMMSPETRQISSKYGTSLLINAIPIYKRLRLAEDSLLMARLTRGIVKYIYKVKVDSCLQKDTQISLLDGSSPTIKEMAEESKKYKGKYVFTVDEVTSELKPNKILDIKKTRRNAQLVRVHLDNNRYVDTTPDHLFMLRNGLYKEAQDLEPGESLMPYYENLSEKGLIGYKLVYDPTSRGRYRYIRKVVKVEWLKEKEDTYDIQIENVSNFPLKAGVFVHNSNLESVSTLMDQYVALLKRARALDTSSETPNYESKFNAMSSIEDIIVPVWGDAGDLTWDKIGGEVDIRWITDIDELRNQLASALRCPVSLLGGHTEEASGALGSEAISKLDIRFARSARRLQRAMKEGITRLCQIHLAYMGLDPDPKLFEVNMAEVSTAEEQELKESLNTGVDVIDKYMDIFIKMQDNNPSIEFDQVEFFNYMNQKILKLNDLNLDDYIKIKKEVEAPLLPTEPREPSARSEGPSIERPEEGAPEGGGEGGGLPPNEAPPGELPVESRARRLRKLQEKKRFERGEFGTHKSLMNLDFVSALPLKESNNGFMGEEQWRNQFGSCKIKITDEGSKDV